MNHACKELNNRCFNVFHHLLVANLGHNQGIDDLIAAHGRHMRLLADFLQSETIANKERLVIENENGNDDSTAEGVAMGSTTFNALVDGILPPILKNNEYESSEENQLLITSDTLAQKNKKENSTKENEASVISDDWDNTQYEVVYDNSNNAE